MERTVRVATGPSRSSLQGLPQTEIKQRYPRMETHDPADGLLGPDGVARREVEVRLTPEGEKKVEQIARLHHDELLKLQGIFQVPGVQDLVLEDEGEGGSGSDALYRGPVAADLVARVRGHAVPGMLSEADLAAYVPRQREPICTRWLQIYRVCGFPPPSSGHLAVMQILGMLERLPSPAPGLHDRVPNGENGVPGPDWLHAYTEAARLAFADRAE